MGYFTAFVFPNAVRDLSFYRWRQKLRFLPFDFAQGRNDKIVHYSESL
jgi:hypothetical protein